VDDRERLFELRAQGLSYKKIGELVGRSASSVHKELHRPVKPSEGPEPLVSASPLPRRLVVEEDDPELAAHAKRLRLKEMDLAELELDRRRALMEKPGGDGGGMALVVMEAIRGMESRLDRLATQRAVEPSPDPLKALAEGLGTLARVQQQVTMLQPPAPMRATTAGDLELTVAMRKVEIEEKALIEKAASEARRNDMLTDAIKQFLPVGVGAFQNWLSEQQKPKPAFQPQIIQGGQPGPPPQPVRMDCANCGAKFSVVPEAGEAQVCTQCGGPLHPIEAEVAALQAQKPAWPEDATFG
jgi:hypothetical protein